MRNYFDLGEISHCIHVMFVHELNIDFNRNSFVLQVPISSFFSYINMEV